LRPLARVPSHRARPPHDNPVRPDRELHPRRRGDRQPESRSCSRLRVRHQPGPARRAMPPGAALRRLARRVPWRARGQAAAARARRRRVSDTRNSPGAHDADDAGDRGDLVTGEDGLARPPWASTDPLLRHYYDTEWGMPVRDERGVFERLSLEAFQAGLSWAIILRKRDAFRAAFEDFDPDA